MADNRGNGQHSALSLVQPRMRLTKRQQKEEKKLKKELESRQAAEKRAEKLRLEMEAKEKAKKDAVEKKRLHAERLAHLEAERRRLAVKERLKQEAEDLKRRMEEILHVDPVTKIVLKKSITDKLRDNLMKYLNRKSIIDSLSKNKLHQLSKLVSQSSDFEFTRALFQEGYSVTTNALPIRILFDIGHGAGTNALSEKNGEREFFCGLSSWLFGSSQDLRYRIQFDHKGNSIANSITGLECKMIGKGKPQTLEGFCLSLKKFFIDNRIVWRDLELPCIIAAIEEEPGRTERLKDAYRAFRSRATLKTGSPDLKVLLRSLQHEIGYEKRIRSKIFDGMIAPMISCATAADWIPLIRDSTQFYFDHLCDAKLILSMFPPSLVKCGCPMCSGWQFVYDKFSAAVDAYGPKFDNNDLKAWRDVFAQDYDFENLADAFERSLNTDTFISAWKF